MTLHPSATATKPRAPAPIDLDAARDALRRRDPGADGRFVYSVRTTGVYCRPSCAARPARPENVAFHRTCEDAEMAGFRACKRCRPNEPGYSRRHADAIAKACRLIEVAESLPALDRLAAAAGMSPFHFHRTFKRLTGVTPKAYADARLAERVSTGLLQAATVTEAVYDAGFNSASRFYASSNHRLGMTPTDYRRGGTGATIRFAVGECSLGAILVAATPKGVCAISLGPDPDDLVRQLQDRFRTAELKGGDPGFEDLVGRVVGMVEAPGIGVDLPLDISGTAFQQRVWQALRGIPAGETASYADVARAIGEPKAVRAVAQACGANPVAVAIPCHRVVRQDGALSGYRWGVERKRELLAREASRAADAGAIAAMIEQRSTGADHDGRRVRCAQEPR